MATIALITPTIGRPSLEPCLRRAQQLLLPGDIHIIAIDAVHTHTDRLQHILGLSLPMVHTLPVSSLRSIAGNAQRDAGISAALALVPSRPDYVVFNDDDDLLSPAGVAVIHDLEPNPDALHFFSVKWAGGLNQIKENEPITMRGNIGGSNLVPALRPDIPKWMDINVYEADVFFYARCKHLYKTKIIHPEPIIETPHCPSGGSTWSVAYA